MDYNFEWDPKKARSKREKQGVAFEEAATVFRDPRALNMYDPDHSDTEDRWVTLGVSGSGRLLVVCHTYIEEPGDSAAIPHLLRPPADREGDSELRRGLI
jgi:uncharacterized DUF497 family protein